MWRAAVLCEEAAACEGCRVARQTCSPAEALSASAKAGAGKG